MLVSPKWQTMWMDSQYCSKNLVSLSVPSQQAKKILEDLKTNCSSPHKAVQLEALRCWGSWINTQNPEDWKLNTVCYAAVRPLHGKKLQPLYKDADVCKLKLSLIWGLIVKVQSIVQLEGPQYIVEVFLQFCLTWLSSSDMVDDEVSVLIFQLILSLFQKEESWNICDEESFPSLNTEILSNKKVFQNFADKLSNFFIHWKKVTDKAVIIKIWKCFLRNCEDSCENIPTPIWHKIFKILAQICSEDSQSLKYRLGFLHGCATTLKTVLPSSKFIDYGNLLITPCEALLKKLVDLCLIQTEEDCYLEMFNLSQGISRVLMSESMKLDGYEQCFYVMDMLEDFSLKSLFWGVWCGLVYCFQIWLEGIDRSQYTKTQMKFFRKLRGFAVNFDLDYKYLPKDCLLEVENHIRILNVTCISCLGIPVISVNSEVKSTDTKVLELVDKHETVSKVESKDIVPVAPKNILGQFSAVTIYSKPNRNNLGKSITIKLDLIRDILKVTNMAPIIPLLKMFNFRLLTFKMVQEKDKNPKSITLEMSKTECKDFDKVKKKKSNVSKKSNAVVLYEKKTRSETEEEVISTPRTRSRKRAEEEISKELEDTPRKRRRKSFEIIVQEIFEKNKLRKTEKNTKKKSPVAVNKKERRKRKTVEEEKEKEEICTKRVLRNSNSIEAKNQKEKKPKVVTDGRLENYFKVITKKPLNGMKINEKKTKKKAEINSEKKEVGWKQTSLKMIMTPEDKTETVKDSVKLETPKKKKEKKVIEGKDMAKVSPYKEVLHDHEYAKIESENESCTSDIEDKSKTVVENTEIASERKPLVEIQQLDEERTPVKKVEVQILSEPMPVKLEPLLEKKETVDSPKKQSEEPVVDVKQPEKEELIGKELKTDLETPKVEVTPSDIPETGRGKKRRMLDSLKPNKKMKVSVDEKIEENVPCKNVPEEEKCEAKIQSVDLTEKENKASPLKVEEKEVVSILKVKGDASPKTMNGTISSRALRMIALLPESTMLGQVHREPACKAEVSKCKKAPNVNVSSRASKMLALLSGNGAKEVEEVIETDDEKQEECNSVTKASTPTVKTPVSTLKSPNSIKKRKSIMFDDAKNETVLYEIDTPPSKILEEKKKFQITKLQEMVSTVTS